MSKKIVKNSSDQFGIKKVKTLIIAQSLPAAISTFILSLNSTIDILLAGNYIGSYSIAAISVVYPIVFLVPSIGLSIGVGGGTVISRNFGKKKYLKARKVFGNMLSLNFLVVTFLTLLAWMFSEQICIFFGAKGGIFDFAMPYYRSVLPGIPLLSFSMLLGNFIRSEGKPKIATTSVAIMMVINIGLDLLFLSDGGGMKELGIASFYSYLASFLFIMGYVIFNSTLVPTSWKVFKLKKVFLKEIISSGMVTFCRQIGLACAPLIINNILFFYGKEVFVTMFGIMNRISFLVLATILGFSTGIQPLVSYNDGLGIFFRVKKILVLAIKFSLIASFLGSLLVMYFSSEIISYFTSDLELISKMSGAIKVVFILIPFLSFQFIMSSYLQAQVKYISGLCLILIRPFLFLSPLLFLIPLFFDANHIWFAFPIADFLIMLVSVYFLNQEIKKINMKI